MVWAAQGPQGKNWGAQAIQSQQAGSALQQTYKGERHSKDYPQPQKKWAEEIKQVQKK